ncbi:MAG: winged helix-turn-helix transcriptional regulator [Candidatus Woesearchaeota archaeon]
MPAMIRGITMQGMAKELGISPDTVKEYLGRLKGKGLLARAGSMAIGRF